MENIEEGNTETIEVENKNKKIIVVVILALIALGFVFFQPIKDSITKSDERIVPPLESVDIETLEEIVTPKESSALNSLVGVISEKKENSFTIRALSKQIVPEGTIRSIVVTRETLLQRMTPKERDSEGDLLSVNFETMSFNDLSVGNTVIVSGLLETDISNEQEFNAQSISIINELQ